MKRLTITPRKDWLEQLTADGVLWSTTEEGPYWNEAMVKPVYYEFTKAEQEQLETASNDIHHKCIEFLEWLFERATKSEQARYWKMFNITEVATQNKIVKSWNDDEWGLYGRFDFIMTNQGPKLLEYNADTPTILIESAISQWNWFCDHQESGKFGPHDFQFNEVHEALVNHWGDMVDQNGLAKHVNFVATAQVDDFATVAYMAETAKEAGISVNVFEIGDIQQSDNGQFYDNTGEPLRTCFKLYPWEWMYEDEFGSSLNTSATRFIEPAWKMMLSNKALLVVLWEMFPECKYLVPAYEEDYFDRMNLLNEHNPKWVSKPILSREGNNVRIFDYFGDCEETSGLYDEEPRIVQQYIEWVDYDGCYPMLGVWMVGSDAVGLGIREDDGRITGNNSRFIPHMVKG